MDLDTPQSRKFGAFVSKRFKGKCVEHKNFYLSCI